MRPYPEEVLRAIQAGIMAHFAPEVRSAYGQAQIAFSMLLFMVAQRDYDSAVPDLIDANRALRGLLADADAALADVQRDDARAARERLAVLPGAGASLRLSDLRAEHEALRGALAGLAPLIEPAADDAALRAVRAAVFAYLAAD
ncbi:MAG: hypothetical protein ACYC9X_04390, partial [Dehalococcoidia bacterium]